MEDKFPRVVLLVERYLSQIFGSLRVYREGNEFLIPWGSTVINVEVRSDQDDVYLYIYSPVALRVKPEKDLLRFLLVENASLKMCAFSVEFEKGFLDIILGTKIDVEFLTKDLLSTVTIRVGNLANEYGNEIIAVFGGISFKEYVERERAEKRPSSEGKILHDIFDLENLKVALEVYNTGGEDRYLIVGKVVDTGQVFIKAERRGDLRRMSNFIEDLKRFILTRDIKSLRKSLKHYEVEEHILYNVIAGKEKDRLRKLKDIEKEINLLTDLLMRGEISEEEYRRRIRDLDKEL
ncbi:MAG: hypothetical protein Q9N26_02890 [Aquificota bacterium]|nr:hypothetical protein [Aquificota bacterium]